MRRSLVIAAILSLGIFAGDTVSAVPSCQLPSDNICADAGCARAGGSCVRVTPRQCACLLVPQTACR